MKRVTIPADVRSLIVSQLGRALADAWRRQQQITDPNAERPEPLAAAAGRDVRDEGGPTMNLAQRPSLAARLAAFFTTQPNTWIDGRRLAAIAGAYAWRTRVSDLRRPPFSMVIENRQKHVKTNTGMATISQYRFATSSQRVSTEVSATASAPTLTAAV